MLQRVTAALTRALTVREVADVVTMHSHELFGSTAALLFLFTEDGSALELHSFAGVEAGRVAPYLRMAVDSDEPMSQAVRADRPVWIGTRAALLAEFPHLAAPELDGRPLSGLVALPLRDTREIIGGLAFSFYSDAELDPVQRDFFLTVGAQCGLAIERARSFEAERRANAQLQRQQERLALLARAAETLSSSLDSRRALVELTRLVVPTLVDWCAIDEVGPQGQIRRIAVEHRDPAKVALAQQLAERYPVRPDQLHGVPAVLRTGETEWVPEIPDSILVATTHDAEHLALVRSLGLSSYAVVPLIARGRVLGALSLVTEGEHRLTDEDLRFAEELARRAALALENARLYETTREHAETLTTINELGRVIAAELDQQKVVQAVTDAATTLTDAQFGAFFYNVTDERGGRYMLYTISGVARENFSKFPMPRNTAVFAPTFNGEGVVRSDDITKDERYGKNDPVYGMPEGHLPVRSYLAVPVTSRSGEVIGGIFLGHAEVAVFGERAETLAQGLAAQAAVAMDNARLYGDAQRLIKALEATNRELDQFAYVTSHDLKAPLRGIGSLAEWIEEDLGDALTGDVRRKMGLLRGRVARMEALIQGILDFSRAARATGKREDVDVHKLVLEIAELLAAPPPARVEVEGRLPVLNTTRVSLQQVLMNLIGNALKHAGRADAQVVVSATETADFWEFRVRDNGPGIAAQYHERVWGIFQTLEARDKVESTGIGLAIVRKIVEGRGGVVGIDSAAGQGATFRFTWPKRDDAR